MKKLVLAVTTVLVAAVVATSAAAEGPVYEDSEFLCGIALPNGEGGYTGVYTYDSSFTIFASGKAVLRCNGWTEPGSRFQMNPNTDPELTCGYYIVPLPNWNTSVKRGGEVQLECRGHVDLNDLAPTSSSAGNAGTS
jgi:hypothetical protein